jgi:hypothetical protein
MTNNDSDLWPEDIRNQEFIAPLEILNEQAKHLEQRTNGVLIGETHVQEVIEEEKVQRISIRFEVHAPRIDKRVKMFEVVHQPELEYPVALIPPEDDIPNYLKEKYYQPGAGEIMKLVNTAHLFSTMMQSKGSWVENEWVATSPIVFRQKLKDILSMASVKAIVLSLIAKSNRSEEASSETQSSDSERPIEEDNSN